MRTSHQIIQLLKTGKNRKFTPQDLFSKQEILEEKAGKYMFNKTYVSGDKTIDQIRTETGLPDKPEDILRHFHREYSALFQPRLVDERELGRGLANLQPTVPEDEFIRLKGNITEDETKRAIQQLATQKLPGPDGPPAELYRNFTEPITTPLTNFINLCFQRGEIPSDVTEGLTSFIFKGGEKDLPKSWRLITLCTTEYKIIAMII